MIITTMMNTIVMKNSMLSLVNNQSKLSTQINSLLNNYVTVGYYVDEWLNTLKSNTRQSYRSCIRTLYDQGLIDPEMSIEYFSRLNINHVLDSIKRIRGYTEGTLQHKASAFISFTNYLSRQFDGFRRAVPQKQGVGRTFYSISEKCATATMTHKQWHDWLYELEQINYRDYLVAIVMLQGAKRISEVLSLQIGQIDWTMNRIEFKQSKTGGTLKYTVIVYPKSVMDKLNAYIGDRQGMVFITSTGNKVCQNQLQVTFEKAGQRANIKYKVHPHVLRASAITYLVEQGYSSDQIMRISGHSSQKSVLYYDRSDIVNNISSEVSLV